MKKLVINSILISMALILSYVERMFPIGLIVPIPGIKLGLANVVTIFAIFYLDMKSAIAITVLRCVIASTLFGSIYSLLFSLSGALFALLVMAILKKGYNRWFSILGISIGGAAAHNIGQILIASLIMQSTAIFPYLSILLLAAVITGTLTGLVFSSLMEHIDKINIFKRRIFFL
ncbi:MAG TPA: Gx transporter family protein [Clostridiales bacterium]|nr:Gx transporter family protein [Clostridiales bacterium]